MLLPSYSKAVLGPRQPWPWPGAWWIFFEREQIIFHLNLGSHISIHQDRNKIWGNIRPHMEGFSSSHSKLGQSMRHMVTVPGTKHEFRENKRGMAQASCFSEENSQLRSIIAPPFKCRNHCQTVWLKTDTLCTQVSCPFNSSHTSDHFRVQCRSYMVHLASSSRQEIASFVSRNETPRTSLRLHMKSSIHIDLDQVCSWRDPNLGLLRLGRFLNVHRSEISQVFCDERTDFCCCLLYFTCIGFVPRRPPVPKEHSNAHLLFSLHSANMAFHILMILTLAWWISSLLTVAYCSRNDTVAHCSCIAYLGHRLNLAPLLLVLPSACHYTAASSTAPVRSRPRPRRCSPPWFT